MAGRRIRFDRWASRWLYKLADLLDDWSVWAGLAAGRRWVREPKPLFEPDGFCSTGDGAPYVVGRTITADMITAETISYSTLQGRPIDPVQ